MTGSVDLDVSAIILAGGRSSRYGSDKLSVRVDGTTLLDHAVAALAAVAVEIIVVVAPGDDRMPAPIDRPLRVVSDPELHGGPLVGFLAGLEAAAQPVALIAGGDMPSLRPEVLHLMIRTLATADAAFGAVILEMRGRRQPLPAVVRTGAATDAARHLLAGGERSLRSLFDHLSTRSIAEADWRPLDPEGVTLHDVDVPADLGG